VESWLNQHTYCAEDRWFGNLRLALYGTTALPPAEQSTQMSGALFGDRIELTGIDLPGANLAPGDVVPLTLFWQARKPVAEDLKVFVHLVDAGGRLIAQRDSEPVGGLQPTTMWELGEAILDRHGVLLPDPLPPGEYWLIVGLYDPVSGDRLPVSAGGDAAADDHLTVGHLAVSHR
jgi:hypothetical protein